MAFPPKKKGLDVVIAVGKHGAPGMPPMPPKGLHGAPSMHDEPDGDEPDDDEEEDGSVTLEDIYACLQRIEEALGIETSHHNKPAAAEEEGQQEGEGEQGGGYGQ